ncbi:hypothetical protein QE152_g34473 [Popillia japonica]|uniref:Uncharacterized protein n=1 Tax=Popillia japonica TaxID=7064 RepID=A0AAW1ISX9_POPJA
MVSFQEILIQNEEEVTLADLLQNFTAATDDVIEHTENVTEISNLKLPETFSLIHKAMEIFTDHGNDESRSKNLMNAAKDVEVLYTIRKMKVKQQTLGTKTYNTD